ncbi:copper resistance protein CopC [Vreelandella lionensis]
MASPFRIPQQRLAPSDTLSAGDYQVRWRGLSDDGHMMSDGFNFSVEP